MKFWPGCGGYSGVEIDQDATARSDGLKAARYRTGQGGGGGGVRGGVGKERAREGEGDLEQTEKDQTRAGGRKLPSRGVFSFLEADETGAVQRFFSG
jgi:hypothetical protein